MVSAAALSKFCKFLSTPSARRATPWLCCVCCYHRISIHALREEGDKVQGGIRVPEEVFLSTPSARRATPWLCCVCCYHRISIHALREEGDKVQGGIRVPEEVFLSTPSARRATHSSKEDSMAIE